MAVVLLGWEIGAGLGHVLPLIDIATRLRESGHHPVLALRDVVSAGPRLRDAGFGALQAPIWQAPVMKDNVLPPTRTMSDVLYTVGMSDANRILSILASWDHLIAEIRPQLAIAEFAPGLCLAARGRLPVISMGNGFSQPPTHIDEYPPLQSGPPSLTSQQDVLDTVNAAMAARGEPPLPRLPAIFEADEQVVRCLPELDPYTAWRKEPTAGNFALLPPPLPPAPEKRVFAYLDNRVPMLREVLDGLAATDLPATVYARGIPPAFLASWQGNRITFVDRPPDLTEILKDSAVAIHYGGLGTSSASLGAGRPQVVVPYWLERRLNAKILSSLGVAIAFQKNAPAAAVAQAIRKAADDRSINARARDVAADIAKRGPANVPARIVERCLQLLDAATA